MPKQVPDELIGPIREAVFAGHKIEAIKLYRVATGQGLKEAKDFVEALESEMRQREPENFAASARGTGCSVSTAILISLIATIVKYLIA